ncbi:MAG: epoxyqueuosine reductase [Thermodesulfobacteriota bacterium]
MNSKQVKEIASALGTDLCGIAPVERFLEAPEGFRPQDILSETKSIIVLAKRFPDAPFSSKSLVPYTFACDVVLREVFRITCKLAIRLQDLGVLAVPIPSEPYEFWDVKRREGRGILSLRHAGYLAGLGVLGRNTLLMNKKFGNRITLGALLLNVELEPDAVASYVGCGEKCRACLQICPASALDGQTVNQKLCREKSQYTTKKGYFLYLCHRCRSVCPNGAGIKEDI